MAGAMPDYANSFHHMNQTINLNQPMGGAAVTAPGGKRLGPNAQAVKQ